MQVGRDVVVCLNEAMERQGLDMRVSALVCCLYCNRLVNRGNFVQVLTKCGIGMYDFGNCLPNRLMILLEH